MRVDHVEVLVEEPSMEAALRVLLPMMVGSLSFEIYTHQGKADLLARLPERLRGYAAWLPESYRVLVVVDQDGEDCRRLKSRLEMAALGAGMVTKSMSGGSKPYSVVNRIAVEELEAWFFGDWEAVRSAYPRVSTKVPRSLKHRAPDEIAGGTWEALERIFQASGYFKGGLAKVEAARAIASWMVPMRNTSPSFRALRDVLSNMALLKTAP